MQDFMTTLPPINRFTDARPLFPYASSEARAGLGIPDVPVIHLAITQLAERLMLMTIDRGDSKESVRILALRCASYGVLMKLPIEAVEMRFLTYVDLPTSPDAFDRAQEAAPVDWLGDAMACLGTGQGATVNSVRQLATPYGWKGM